MFVFEQTPEFSRWLLNLKDPQGKTRVLARIRAAQLGRFGDCEPVGEGVHEMRIHRGPGYRVYFSRRGKVIYLLLIGGDRPPRNAISNGPGNWPATSRARAETCAPQ